MASFENPAKIDTFDIKETCLALTFLKSIILVINGSLKHSTSVVFTFAISRYMRICHLKKKL